MLYEFRRYSLAPGTIPIYLEAFERIALPLIRKHMTMLAFWTSDTGELNQGYHLWTFKDAQDRTERRAAFQSEPLFKQEFMPIALPLLRGMTSTLLNPVEFAGGLPLFKRVE